jgi:hypothetical protein
MNKAIVKVTDAEIATCASLVNAALKGFPNK